MNAADETRGREARKRGQPREPNTLAMSPDERRAWLRGWDSPPSVCINPSPDQPGHVCGRDEHGQRLDTFSGPRTLMIQHYRGGYDVLDEDGRKVEA